MPNFFYFDQTNQKRGPVSEQQLKELAVQGLIGPHTPMETDTGHRGVAGQIPGLFPVAAPSAQAAPSFGGNAVLSGAPPVPDYLIWSIITTLCCCLPLGVVGIIFSILGKNDLQAGKYDDAVKKSKIAFWCNIAGLVGGVIITAISILIQVLAMM